MLRGRVLESNISPRHNIQIERLWGPVCLVVRCLALPCCQDRPSGTVAEPRMNRPKITEKRKKREKEK